MVVRLAARAAAAPARRGLAIITALWWLLGASAVLVIAFGWTLQRSRISRKIFEVTDQAWIAEAIQARELARLGRAPWTRRWYAAAPASPNVSGSVGEFDYTGHLQDVGDHWTDPSLASGGILVDHSDLFLRVVHARGPSRPTSSCHFLRVVFRRPTPARPTPYVVRRQVRTEDFNPASAGDRDRIVTLMNGDEQERETNRPSSEILEYEVREWHRSQPTFSLREIKANLDRSHVQSEVARHESLTGAWIAGRWNLLDPEANGVSPRFTAAVARFQEGVTLAATQCTHVQRYTVARSLYALAWSTWALGRTYPRCQPRCTLLAPCLRHSLLADAMTHFTTLCSETAGYPWIPDPGDADSAPVRFEAPHAHVARAFVRLSQEDPGDVSWDLAAAQARTILRTLRNRYPEFHLWGEGAVTGFPRGTDPPDPDADELTWFLEQLLARPVLSIGGIHDPGLPLEPAADGRLFRWVPGPGGLDAGQWIEEAWLEGPRFDMAVSPLQATATGGGRFVGDRIVVLGGQTADDQPARPQVEIYDPFTRTSSVIPAAGAQARSCPATVQTTADGAVLVIGGYDPASGPAAPLAACDRFDPVTETFMSDPSWDLGFAQARPRAVLLPDGRVLSVDGNRGELFDCSFGPCSWSLVSGSLATTRNFASLDLLDDGLALVAGGGLQTVNVTSSCDLFVPGPGMDTFFPTGSVPPTSPVTVGALTGPRWYGWSARITEGPDRGMVLIGNGFSTPVPGAVPLATIDRYDPATGDCDALTGPGPSTLATGGEGGTRRVAVLPGGRFLITGGRPAGGGTDNVTEILRYAPGGSQLFTQPPLPDGLDRMGLVQLEPRP